MDKREKEEAVKSLKLASQLIGLALKIMDGVKVPEEYEDTFTEIYCEIDERGGELDNLIEMIEKSKEPEEE